MTRDKNYWDGDEIEWGSDSDGICRDVGLCDGHYSLFTHLMV